MANREIGAQGVHYDRTQDGKIGKDEVHLRTVVRASYGEIEAGDLSFHHVGSGAVLQYLLKHGSIAFMLPERATKEGKADYSNEQEEPGQWRHDVSTNLGMDYRRSYVMDIFLMGFPKVSSDRQALLRTVGDEYHRLLSTVDWASLLYTGFKASLCIEARGFRPCWNGGYFVDKNILVRQQEYMSVLSKIPNLPPQLYITYSEYKDNQRMKGKGVMVAQEGRCVFLRA